MTNQRIDFEELKEKTRGSFGLVLAHYGIKRIGSGDQARIHCPFHEDSKPSCSVQLAGGLFNCKAGSCGVSGNLLDFVHQMEARESGKATLPEAARALAAICNIDLNGRERPQKARREAKGAETTDIAAGGGKRVSGGSGGQGEAGVKVNRPLGFKIAPREHPYVSERGVSPALALLFGLTFADRGSMAGRLCIPIENHAGQLVAYSGRWVGHEETIPENEEKYKLPAGFHKNMELFNLHRVTTCRHLVVVEGFFGAIRLHGLRVPTVALMGSSISDEQIALLHDHCTALRFVTVLLDGDEAGRKASETVAGRLAWDFAVRSGALPDGMEPDTAPEEVVLRAIGRPKSA